MALDTIYWNGTDKIYRNSGDVGPFDTTDTVLDDCCCDGDTSVEYEPCCDDNVSCNSCVPDLCTEYTVVISGLTNDFACLNGTWVLSSAGSCIWTQNLPSGTCPGTGEFITLSWNGANTRWELLISALAGPCYVEYSGSTDSCDPTGSYPTQLFCVSITCPSGMGECPQTATIDLFGGGGPGSIFVDPDILSGSSPYPANIKKDDVCYVLVAGSETAIDTSTIDGEYTDCDCEEDCPSDCTDCDDPVTVVVSGIMGTQCALGSVECTELNDTYSMSKSGGASSCVYTGSGSTHGHGMSLFCSAGVWEMNWGAGSCGNFQAPAQASGCVPEIGWVYNASFCGGTGVVTVS